MFVLNGAGPPFHCYFVFLGLVTAWHVWLNFTNVHFQMASLLIKNVQILQIWHEQHNADLFACRMSFGKGSAAEAGSLEDADSADSGTLSHALLLLWGCGE